MRTGSETEVETWLDEVEVDDIEQANHQQSTTAIKEIEPGYDETEDADLIRSQRYQVGVEEETEYSGTETEDLRSETDESVQDSEDMFSISPLAKEEREMLFVLRKLLVERGRDNAESIYETKREDAQTGSPRFQEENRKKLDLDEKRKREMHLKLYRAARRGNWGTAEKIYKNNETSLINHKIKGDETALHIAVSAGQIDFVRKLIEGMSKEAIRAPNKVGNTAFCYAASSGNVELARAMLKNDEDKDKDEHLANIRGSGEMLPIYMAALLGHKDMVSFLYDKTSDKELKDERIDLLVTLIDNDIYDVALTMVKEHKDLLATARDRNKETALDALRRKNLAHLAPSGTRTKLFNLFCCGADQKSTPIPKEAKELRQLLKNEDQDEDQLRNDPTEPVVIRPSRKEIFKATKEGNLGPLTALIRSYPHLVFEVDSKNYSIFHIAVLHRHKDVFKLIRERDSYKSLISALKDNDGNNLLHLAAKLPPPNKLHAIQGAALQLQHELLWFKEVKKVVKKNCVKAKNMYGKTPEEVFVEEHMELLEKGEQWMRDAANSCMLVATLIATVVFAAAFTVPGGNNKDGNPMFVHKAQFQVFAIAEAISLIFSVSALLTFLSIVTSRHAPYDFIHSLPNKLFLGLGMLIISVVAMMIAYIAAIFIMFKDGLLRIAIPIAVISVFPVVLFIWHQSGLLRDVVRSTYMYKSLFQPNKPTLFFAGDSGKATKKKGVAYVSED